MFEEIVEDYLVRTPVFHSFQTKQPHYVLEQQSHPKDILEREVDQQLIHLRVDMNMEYRIIYSH